MAGEKILVIDDNPSILKSLETSVEEYHFIGVLTGEEGLKILLKPNDIDLVILDVRLPGIGGIAALKEIKKMGLGLGVIMLTGFTSKEVLMEALRGGADDFIEKPFEVDDMAKKIDQVLWTTNFRRYSNPKKFKIHRAKRYIEKNPGKDISLKTLSDLSALSEKYLSRAFRRETGESITGYKIRVKMEKSKKLLVQKEYTIAEIAYKLGYMNPQAFMKRFKKAFGVTPTEYRCQEGIVVHSQA